MPTAHDRSVEPGLAASELETAVGDLPLFAVCEMAAEQPRARRNLETAALEPAQKRAGARESGRGIAQWHSVIIRPS